MTIEQYNNPVRVTQKQRDKAKKFLFTLAKDMAVLPLCDPFLLDKSFCLCTGSGSPDKHHYGDGGLLVNTADVVNLCLRNRRLCNLKLSPRIVFLAAFYHDTGKISDYVREEPLRESFDAAVWCGNEHKKQIGHLFESAHNWEYFTIANPVTPRLSTQDIEAVTHAILSHHGQPAWGSFVEPQTQLAWLLHLCDMLSARLDDCRRIM